ncbi:MAG: universal stress protein [Actinomycetia bacterium]|nr:universal stress protein [Actinomycetes bacterium]
MRKIIVGIDGSEQSTEALQWALDYASPGDQIVATHSWQLPPRSGFEFPAYNPADVEVYANQLVERVVSETVPEDSDGPKVMISVHHGHPGRVLIDESAGADLIVVGSRGFGGFRGLLLGSVSTYVVHHATCPVVIMPHDGQEPDDA